MKPYTKKTLPDFDDGMLDLPIKAKTLVKKIKDMNNKSGDCLGIEIDYNPNKIVRTPVKDKDKQVEIEKLVINGIPENPEKELDTDSYNDYQISLKINELVEWINDHQRQHDLDEEDTDI